MALTKTQTKVLAYLESNGPATILNVAEKFFIDYQTASYHLRNLKKMKEIHRPRDEIRNGFPVKIFKSGAGKDAPFRQAFYKIEAKKKARFYELEQKEIAKRRAEALANAQMLLAKPNTVFGWLLEQAR